MSYSEVYPRAYGETSVRRALRRASAGLSPRIRGNRRTRRSAQRPSRSIPAHTGKPSRRRSRRWRDRVYPRAYGETGELRFVRGENPGLSPRIRGNHDRGLRGRTRLGSIPAHTGKPDLGLPAIVVNRVYPRAYGETAAEQTDPRFITGLSPRIRGNLRKRKTLGLSVGSIPAHTGKPERTTTRWRSARVYPRAYGETKKIPQLVARKTGLSPRIRGNR